MNHRTKNIETEKWQKAKNTYAEKEEITLKRRDMESWPTSPSE